MPSMTLTCAICNLPMQKSRTSRPQGEAAHNACRTGGASSKTEYMRNWHAQYRAEHGRSQATHAKRKARGVDPLAVVDCFLCHEPLENVRSKMARYPLHKRCREAAPLWVLQGRDKPNPRREAFQRKIDRAARGTAGSRVFTCGGCQWCGEQFVGIGVYCSKKCSAAVKFNRRNSGLSFSISPRKRREIYERDNWTCQLCKFPVDQNLHYLNDWAPSLDHIIPRSTTLVPDHSPSNLQLAHRMCNSMKGDGSNMTETVFLARVNAHFKGSLAA